MYNYDEVLSSTLDYFDNNELSANIFVTKYALQDNEGNYLEKNPSEMHHRIAKELARVEKNKFKEPMTEGEIYAYLHHFERIIPQGSPMFGIGNYHQYISLSNCFVVDSPTDSYGGICRTDEHIVQISKRRGGIGYDISNLRPAFMTVQNSAKTTTGAVSFMHRFSNSGKEVGQNGRRAAQMITISVHHPDILDFVSIKNDPDKVTGANISVRLSDEFLNAVRDGTDYEQRWPENSPTFTRKVDAKQVWDSIIHSAWLRAEPGLLFWDTITRECPADCYPHYKSCSTNPCAELNLSANDSCRLLVLNLMYYVNEPFTPNAKFDFDRFWADVKIAQRFMDDIVDLELEHTQRIIDKIESDPEPAYVKQTELELWQNIYIACKNGRRTGTGLTALADCLAALGIKYDNQEGLDMVDEIYKTLKLAAYESSVDMAQELGAFTDWDKDLEVDNPFLLRIKEENPNIYNRMRRHGRRNISLLTSAPCGTISLLASSKDEIPGTCPMYFFGTTSGIEPVFKVSHVRRKRLNPSDKVKPDFVDDMGQEFSEYHVYHPQVNHWDFKQNPPKDISEAPWVESDAIDWKMRVKLQAVANRHIDHSISSTINLPADVTEEEVAKIYTTAWESGCKGITVYRDGCRSGVLITKRINKTTAPKRPKELPCEIYHTSVQKDPYVVFIGLMDDDPYEVMAYPDPKRDRLPNAAKGIIRKARRGHYTCLIEGEVIVESITEHCSSEQEALTRAISTSLRHGADIGYVVHQLEKTKGDMLTFAKALARVLKKYIADGFRITGEICPECESENVIREEGCFRCLDCGMSKCS